MNRLIKWFVSLFSKPFKPAKPIYIANGSHPSTKLIRDAMSGLQSKVKSYYLIFVQDSVGHMIEYDSHLVLENWKRKSNIYRPTDPDRRLRNDLNYFIINEVFGELIDKTSGFLRIDVNFEGGVLSATTSDCATYNAKIQDEIEDLIGNLN
jgi:hypothetical protein